MDEETVRRVARVARLDLTDEEAERYGNRLKELLFTFDALDEVVPKEGFELCPMPVEDRLRDDDALSYPDPDRLRREMRASMDGWVRGPRLR